jgi:hypothetical protein
VDDHSPAEQPAPTYNFFWWLFLAIGLPFIAIGLVLRVVGVAMIVASIPGHRTWKTGVARNSNPALVRALALGWLGQSIVSVSFAVGVIKLATLVFGYFSIGIVFRCVGWVYLCLLCVLPAHKISTIYGKPWEPEREYYTTTSTATELTTFIGFWLWLIFLK